MRREFIYEIQSKYGGKKISEFLKNQGYSEQVLTTLRHSGDVVFLNDKAVHMNATFPVVQSQTYTSSSLYNNDISTLKIILEEQPSEHVIPVDISLDVVYEDEDIIVINKPAGLPSHPSRSNAEYTLGNAVCYHCKMQNNPIVFRCINRLDKDTSGLTVIAKNILAAGLLSQQRLKGNLRREYTAIVRGIPAPKTDTINLPIERIEEGSVKRHVDLVNGKTAITHYEVMTVIDNIFSVVRLHLDTGRTHQIRVHMSHIGHPLLGDKIYNPDYSADPIQRHALHANHLEFDHPITGVHLSFDAPLPADMKEIMISS